MLEKEYIEVGENTSKHIINKVQKGSIAEELGIEVGDILLAIDDKEIEDVFDYRYYINSESMLMLIQKKDGEVWELDIEHNYEDIGIEFGSGLMCDYRTCTNNCVFCFIDQMPKGMRDTLYFKDDDSRLSFLQGNYITLTNMKEKDIDRIIEFRLAPINISVHTTNPELRVRMLHNKFAGTSLKYIDKLYEHEIPMNGQIVMCKGYNDGAELERSIKDLLKYAPVMESVSVVPVGITKYRTSLAKLQLIDKKTAEETVDMIEKYQKTESPFVKSPKVAHTITFFAFLSLSSLAVSSIDSPEAIISSIIITTLSSTLLPKNSCATIGFLPSTTLE